MALEERSATDLIWEAHEQHVARGVSMPSLVAERARGALIWNVDGRESVDFAGALGCQNLGHDDPAIVRAIHEQVDRTGPVWAIEHYRVEPDLVVGGNSLGGTPKSREPRPRGAQARAPAGRGDRSPAAPGARGDGAARLRGARARPDARIEFPEPSPDRGAAAVGAAREEGLILFTCGLYGNVIRILVPFAVTDPQLERGLAILEGAVGG